MYDILWLTMRRMRLPLILLLLVFGFSMFGMMMIPGLDNQGNPYHLNFLEAGYFVAFMSTTIGFGEIPYVFTDAQRLFVFSVIYLNVGIWLYSAGSILALLLDERFHKLLLRARFIRRVSWLGDDFYIICGLGDTGEQILQGLDQRNLQASVIELNEDRIHMVQINPTIGNFPMLAADAGDSEALSHAGLDNPHCRGIIASTNDDHTNLKIALTAKLLHPDKVVLARCESETVAANMASFGTDYIIDPYEIFAERLELAIHSSIKYLVQDWLIAVPGTKLKKAIKPHDGPWLVCGLGRFGSKVAQRMQANGINVTVVDQDEQQLSDYPHAVQGRGTEAQTLMSAGIDKAVGLIAGTADDVDNLSIIMTAHALNPDLFIVGRQETGHNDALFEKAKTDLIARRSHIVARRTLALVTTPLLRPFLEYMIHSKDELAQRLEHQLRPILNGYAPDLWLLNISGNDAEGLRICKQMNIAVSINDLSHNTRLEEDLHLACVCLVLERGSQRIFLPASDTTLIEGDRLLFAGRSSARREMFWTLSDPNRLLSYSTGVNLPRGAVWRWWYKKRKLRS